MSKTKIAFDLAVYLMNDRRGVATRQFRALLAVVRAAQAAIDVEERLAGVSILADPESFTDADVRMARALSRLARGAARKVGP